MAARLDASRAGVRPGTATAAARRAGLAWPRLPAAAELAAPGVGYPGYALVRPAIHADRQAAFAHPAQLRQAGRRTHRRIEPWPSRLAAARPAPAGAAGYYHGLPHFVVTPPVPAWLYRRRAAASGRLRPALALATTAANVVSWARPAAPPRLAVPGMTGILVTGDILGAADPHGATSLVNPYPAMPSLHVAWGRLVRHGHRHHYPPPAAAPGLGLPRRHHAGRAGLGQPLPARCSRRGQFRHPEDHEPGGARRCQP